VNPEAALERLVRDEWAAVVATLVRDTGELALAEDCVAEAVVRALTTWPTGGVPIRPGAWLTTTARRIAIDELRRRGRFGSRAALLAADVERRVRDGDEFVPPPIGGDEQLELLLACCHPALAPELRVALTLRAVAGLTTAEIAEAFLVPEATMAQRLVRGKRKIAEAGIAFTVPEPARLEERLADVMGVIYLVFNQGYASRSPAELVRGDLCDDAIRLARLLVRLVPGDSEAHGLLALLLLADSRRATRVDADGALILLERQDRSRWDRRLIEEGARTLAAAWAAGPAGPYCLQAAIAYEHAVAPVPEATDWLRIAELYAVLAELTASPVVQLNRAVAVAMVDGPAAGLCLVDGLGDALSGYHYWHAARADLLRRMHHWGEAAAAYERAAELAGEGTEARFLRARAAELSRR
jgi:RNA polymerase sigma-70 factor (ECF subfamily)